MQLRLLKLFPLTIVREGEYSLAAKAKVLLKYKSGRADVTFHLTDDIICDCPARVAEIAYDITLNYGQNISCVVHTLSPLNPITDMPLKQQS